MQITPLKKFDLTNRAWRVYAFDMGAIRCSSCGKSLWTNKGVCGNCGNPHARIDFWYQGKTHYYFQNSEGGSLDHQTAKALLGSIQVELDNCRKRGIPFDPNKWKEASRKTIGKKLDEWIEHKELQVSRKRIHPGSLLSIQSYLKNHIKPFFDNILEDELTKSLLSNFLDSLPQNLKRHTRMNIYTVLKSFIKWAGYTVQLPTIDEDDDSKERVSLTYEEQMEALERIPERHRDIIEFCMETGMRTGEVCVLMSIDLTPRGTIWVRRTVSGGQVIETTKAGTRTELTLSDRALEIARRNAGQGYLFMNSRTGQRYTVQTLGFIWKKHSRLEVTLYEATRHSFISQLVDGGASSLQTRTLARHSSVQTTQRYYHGNRVTLKDILNRRGKVIPLSDVALMKGSKGE